MLPVHNSLTAYLESGHVIRSCPQAHTLDHAVGLLNC